MAEGQTVLKSHEPLQGLHMQCRGARSHKAMRAGALQQDPAQRTCPQARSHACTLSLQRLPNMGNCTEDNDTLQNGIVLFQLIVYVPVLSLGIPLNMIAFWVFCCKLKRWTETRVYMINLMVADSFLLFALPFLIYFTQYKHPIDKLCFTIQSIYFTNMPMSIFIITLIANDRYIAIKFPLKAKILRSPLKSASISTSKWSLQDTSLVTCQEHHEESSSCLHAVLQLLWKNIHSFQGQRASRLSKWTETRVYMVNLAVADCLLLFTLPFKTLTQLHQLKVGRWCLVLEGGYFINRLMSIGIITIVAADRYLAIKYPLRAKVLRSPLKAAFASGFLWIVIVCVMILIKKLEDRGQDELCFEKSSVKPSVITLCAIIIGFFIPLIILSYCSIQVIAELLRKKNENCHKEKLIRKAVYIVSANMAVFIICFLPLYLGHLLRFIMDSISSNCSAIQRVNNFVHLASILASTNCCLDAICYYFVNKEFKEASPKLAKSKSEASEEAEIQLPCITH
ncbi:hypothetical protein QYF61_004696 [Mycteria americana]|uniref:G-protein coupled receptors family 1 profile domain-containing protein n=1 Tax=Mycteria americana TaxID=33587 RepID=A0AAN7RWR7_MYCAM|nr:hypothetical protein QYF61_004696 [Mycteria americana]